MLGKVKGSVQKKVMDIEREDGGDKLYIRYSGRWLQIFWNEGQKLTSIIADGPRGPQATNVTKA